VPIDILCELCNRRIATVTYAKVRDYIQQNGEICITCKKKSDQLEAMFEKKKERFIQQFDKLLEVSKFELSEEIKKLAQND